MKLLKGFFALIVVGVVAGFVMSLIAPQLKVSPFDIGDVEDADLDDGTEDLF
jgi:hypothetical protein